MDLDNRNIDVYCVHGKLFISPTLLHFPDSSEKRIAYFFEMKSFYDIFVFWEYLGLSGYEIVFTDTTNPYKSCAL